MYVAKSIACSAIDCFMIVHVFNLDTEIADTHKMIDEKEVNPGNLSSSPT